MRHPANKLLLALVIAACANATCIGAASARSSDRNQPMDIDAGHQSGTLDDRAPTVLTGGVHITQGSLDIRSDRAEISLVGGDPSRAVFTGGPVQLKQTMDDGTPMTASASNVDYNLKTEVVVFTGDVQIQQPRGSMSGQRMVYNLKSGNIDSGGEGAGRVKMRILPRNAQPAASVQDKPAQGKPAQVKPAQVKK
ncbi:MAG TPA: lipopolysaccharide transport periplasmic protein LptA [Luteimonas sp.]|nr:lipopolysaccharide transport periplasmic protein LptA [Luteimonas sp.]